MIRLLLFIALASRCFAPVLVNPFVLASTGYTPPSSNLVLWLSARKETAYSDGGTVQTPTDWSGAGNAPTQATSTSRATFETGEINGLPTFRFDGVDDRWTFSGTGLNIGRNVSGLTVYVVSKSNAAGSARSSAGMSVGTSATANRWFVGHTLGNKLRSGGRRLDADSLQEANGTATYSTGTFYLSSFVFDYTNTDLYQYLNGVADGSNTSFQTSGSTSDTAALGGAVGSASSASGTFWSGDIAEVLVYHAAHNSTTRAAIEAGLMGIFGL